MTTMPFALSSGQYQRSVWGATGIGLFVSMLTALIFSHTALAQIWHPTIGLDHKIHMAVWPTIGFTIGMFVFLIATMVASNAAPVVQYSIVGLFYICSGGLLSIYPMLSAHLNLVAPVVAGVVVFATAATYGAMTRRSLAGVRNFCMVGLFAVIIMSLIGAIFHFGALNIVLSVVSVLIFTGLTASDSQRIQEHAQEAGGYSPQTYAAQVISDSLNMYLNLVNLVLSLINLFNNDD